MEKQVLEFELEKTTPGTYRYKEITKNGQPPRVKTIYIGKWVVGEKPPERIRVTIEGV